MVPHLKRFPIIKRGINFERISSYFLFSTENKMRSFQSLFADNVTLTIQNKRLSKIDTPCITENWLITLLIMVTITLRWRHNEHDGVSNHQTLDCLLMCLFRRRSKKTSKFRVTGFCEGNSPVTGEFPAQRVSNAENVFIWWRHHELQVKFVHTLIKLSGGPSKII